MTQTATTEFGGLLRVAGPAEVARAQRFMRRVEIIPDNPSVRAMALRETRRVGAASRTIAMQHEIPQSLQSTVRLLERSYPEGLSEDRLLPVWRLLYDELSDRNLALVASQVACLEPAIVLNKVYEAAALDVHDPRVQAAAERLKKHGYEAWLAEV